MARDFCYSTKHALKLLWKSFDTTSTVSKMGLIFNFEEPLGPQNHAPTDPLARSALMYHLRHVEARRHQLGLSEPLNLRILLPIPVWLRPIFNRYKFASRTKILFIDFSATFTAIIMCI